MSSTQPTARAYHAAIGIGEKLFIWAGWGGRRGAVKTTTLESVSPLSWLESRQLKGSLPDGLYHAAVTSDGDCAFSFGGETSAGYINTVYEINTRSLLCRELLPTSPSHAPSKKIGSRSVYFEKSLVVYGGWNGQDHTDELHVFDLDKSEYGNTRLGSRA